MEGDRQFLFSVLCWQYVIMEQDFLLDPSRMVFLGSGFVVAVVFIIVGR